MEAGRCVLSKQVHRDDVRLVTGTDAGAGLLRPQDYEADALVTNEADLPLVIFSADCIPTLYYDPVSRCIGAAHAGWRGAAGGIVYKTVRRMQELFGSQIRDLLFKLLFLGRQFFDVLETGQTVRSEEHTSELQSH